jgi:hypothetical protein
MLPYISDYAKYPDSDTRGQTNTPDPSGCDFSPLPPGCPGAASQGGGNDTGGGDGSQVGGGDSNSGPGVGIGVPMIPIKGGIADGGPTGGGSGGGACGSSYVKSKDTIPKKPEDYCADQKGVNFSVINAPVSNGFFLHFSPSTAFSIAMTAGKAGSYTNCGETDSPGSGRVNDHCAMEIWLSAKPGGAALSQCGLIGPIMEGAMLEPITSGGTGTCSVAPGTKFYCNMAVPTEAWGPYPAPFFYSNAGQMIISECNALLLDSAGLWH